MDLAGRYRLVRRVARGGMGEVWEGLAVGAGGFERKVAIKRVFPSMQADDGYLRMFVDEARIASSLHHANIVGILDYGIADGVPFQVLEFVDGTNLEHLALMGVDRGSPLPSELALHACLQVAHALQYAHEARDHQDRPQRIVHRDVSPENVLISWAGDVKLSDFGIAFAADREQKTADGVAKGKLTYMAPEQATGGTIDGRTDLFSLGCVLHRLVTGRSPLTGEVQMAKLLSGGELELGGALADDIRAIVSKAVRRQKQERYASAGAMAEALGTTLAGRISRDPRSMMQEWINTVRPTTQPPPSSKLDEWFGAELILSKHAGPLRVFDAQTTIAEGRPLAPIPVGRQTDEPSLEAAAVAQHRKPSGRRTLLVTASAILGVGLGAFLVPKLIASEAASPPRKSVEPAVSMTAAQVKQTPVTAVANIDPPLSSSPAPAPSESPAAHAKRPPEKHLTAAPSEADTEKGFLAVGGEGSLHKEIFIDGTSFGFAPKQIELAPGDHRVEVVDASGRRSPPRQIHLSPRNTPSAPLRLIFDE